MENKKIRKNEEWKKEIHVILFPLLRRFWFSILLFSFFLSLCVFASVVNVCLHGSQRSYLTEKIIHITHANIIQPKIHLVNAGPGTAGLCTRILLLFVDVLSTITNKWNTIEKHSVQNIQSLM